MLSLFQFGLNWGWMFPLFPGLDSSFWGVAPGTFAGLAQVVDLGTPRLLGDKSVDHRFARCASRLEQDVGEGTAVQQGGFLIHKPLGQLHNVLAAPVSCSRHLSSVLDKKAKVVGYRCDPQAVFRLAYSQCVAKR